MPGPNPEILNFTQNISGFSKPTGYGDSIQDKKATDPGYDPPEYLYLIYISFDDKHNLIVRQLVDEIKSTPADLELKLSQLELKLFQDAQKEQNIEDTDFRNMVWDYPCYITFAVDCEDWRFFWGDKNQYDPIVFLPEKDIQSSGPNPYDENHSFYDAVRTTIEYPPGVKHDAFRFINYLRDANGPLQTPQDVCRYCFEVYLEAPFARPLRPVDRVTILIDPDGQNQGPPDGGGGVVIPSDRSSV
jgi:hypothetical protein